VNKARRVAQPIPLSLRLQCGRPPIAGQRDELGARGPRRQEQTHSGQCEAIGGCVRAEASGLPSRMKRPSAELSNWLGLISSRTMGAEKASAFESRTSPKNRDNRACHSEPRLLVAKPRSGMPSHLIWPSAAPWRPPAWSSTPRTVVARV
jgi:hypothetical protein